MSTAPRFAVVPSCPSRAALVLVLASLTSGVAEAGIMSTGRITEETYFNPGALLGFSFRDGAFRSALGAEVSVHHFKKDGMGLGGFFQWQSMGSGTHRFCLGGQLTAAEAQGGGIEVGGAYETGGERHTNTASLHVAPFVSAGFATLSLRFAVPVYGWPSALPRHGFEGGLNLAIKLPIGLTPSRTSTPSNEGSSGERPSRGGSSGDKTLKW